jgi:hypothetical protein
MASSNQHGDAAASVAPTPARKCVNDFFQKISTDEYIKTQDAQIEDLIQADIMDLRNVQVRAKKRCVARSAKKRCVVRSANETEGSAICLHLFALIHNDLFTDLIIIHLHVAGNDEDGDEVDVAEDDDIVDQSANDSKGSAH